MTVLKLLQSCFYSSIEYLGTIRKQDEEEIFEGEKKEERSLENVGGWSKVIVIFIYSVISVRGGDGEVWLK